MSAKSETWLPYRAMPVHGRWVVHRMERSADGKSSWSAEKIAEFWSGDANRDRVDALQMAYNLNYAAKFNDV